MGSHLSGACWPLSEKRYAGAHCGFSARSRNVTPIESATPLLFFATLRVTSRIDKLRNYQALFSARRRTRRAQVFLTPHSSPLSPRLWAVGPIRPSLVRGLRPRNAPSPKPPAAASVWQYDLDDPLRPGFTPPPRVLADSEYVPAQARQARQLPYIPNDHRYDHRKPATEILTAHSAWTDRTQYTHRKWLSSHQASIE